MASKLPSLLSLRVFETAARHESFSLAAKELSVTQAAVSHQVRGLEEELGYKLFERRPRKVTLTHQGRVLMGAMGRALAEIREALTTLSEEPSGNWVTLSVSPSFAIKWLVPRLESFHQQNPDIEIRLSATDRIVKPGRDGVDLCIRYGEGDYHGFHVQLLVSETVFPVCSPALTKSASRPLMAPGDLAYHTLLHDEIFTEHPHRLDWKHWSEHHNLDLNTRSGLRFSHACHAINAAIAGQGVALSRGCLVADDIRAGRLVRPFEAEHDSPFGYWLVLPKGSDPQPHVVAFVAWLQESLRDCACNMLPPSEESVMPKAEI
ncbi:MAG: transcriptional regulator GcvA [Deltaproteobacteria bacterium]|nr:transcriptional regulator GcvA [Deltaproteobacteria bacterium]